jgi:hypothetical protein
MKEAEQVSKVDPKPAIQTAGIQSPIHQRIVTLDHHETFASQTIHRRVYLQILCLSKSIHHQCQATCQQSSAENRGAKREVRAGSTAGRGSVEQVSHAPLYHQHGESEQCANGKPPSKGSQRCTRNNTPRDLEIALVGHCSRGSAGCQEDYLLIHSTSRQTSTRLTGGMRREWTPLSILDGERRRRFHCRCPPSRVQALQPPSW